MKTVSKFDHPVSSSIRCCIPVNAYASVLPDIVLMMSTSSLRLSRCRNSVANCSSLMYFWMVNSENRSVRSSRSESFALSSVASMCGALTSLCNNA